MNERGSSMRDLPSALIDGEALNERLAGPRPVVFLDYDGTLTPIVDRPQRRLRRPSRAGDEPCSRSGRCTMSAMGST